MRQISRFARLVAVPVIAAAPLLATFSLAIATPADPSTAAKAASGATDVKAEAAAADAVKTAAYALEKEYEAHLENTTAPIRTECNFFTENSNPAVTPKAIIAGLNRNYGTVETTVYVHWQLLSGISGTVDNTLAKALVNVYRNAPIGPMRPGLDPEQKAQFTQAIALMPQSNLDMVNTAFQERIKDWTAASKPFTDYRDALVKLIPVNFDLVTAQFRDGVQRASFGIDADTTMASALANGQTWAAADAKPDQLRELAQDVNSLASEMQVESAQTDPATPGDLPPGAQPAAGTLRRGAYGRVRAAGISAGTGSNSPTAKPVAMFPPQFFTEVEWNERVRGLRWKTDAAKFSSQEDLSAFSKTLTDQANQPDGKAKTPPGDS
jgi:hypothetical protein